MTIAKILLDSYHYKTGVRLTTFELVLPKPFVAQFNTHRVFSRNSASSRAIPNDKFRLSVAEHPYIPNWTKNQKGMQGSNLEETKKLEADNLWRRALTQMLQISQELSELGIHKQECNRLLEPFMYTTIIVTATDYDNFFKLRAHKDTQPDFADVANYMLDLYNKSQPKVLNENEFHIPFIEIIDPNLSINDKIKVSVAMCARVSYVKHNVETDLESSNRIFKLLLTEGHMSPFEHIARAIDSNEYHYNLRGGWESLRYKLEHSTKKE